LVCIPWQVVACFNLLPEESERPNRLFEMLVLELLIDSYLSLANSERIFIETGK
jgi:hypothetical protein